MKNDTKTAQTTEKLAATINNMR